MLDRDTFNAFCASLAHSTHVVQWGNSDVWKIGGKVYCVAGWNKKQEARREQSEQPGNKQEARCEHSEQPGSQEGLPLAVSFKCSEIAFEMLRDTPGCRPAPYLASRGMKWIQRMSDEIVSDGDLKDYVRSSYRIVSLGLTKKLQKQLGLNQEPI